MFDTDGSIRSGQVHHRHWQQYSVVGCQPAKLVVVSFVENIDFCLLATGAHPNHSLSQ